MRENKHDPRATRRVHERDVEAALVYAAKAAGGEIRKVKWIGRRGAPDRRVMLPGRVPFWVELKAPGEKLEPHQAREHARMKACGEVVRVIDTIREALTIAQ